MRAYGTRLTAALAACCMVAMLCGTPPVRADEATTVTGDYGGDMAIDLLVVRPLGVAATALGAALFVIALPFTLPTGSVGDSAQALVAEPAEYTFNRPLGDFDHCGADRHPCGGP